MQSIQFRQKQPSALHRPFGTIAYAGAYVAAATIGVIKAVDLAISAYDAYSSVQDLQYGKTTLGELAIEGIIDLAANFVPGLKTIRKVGGKVPKAGKPKEWSREPKSLLDEMTLEAAKRGAGKEEISFLKDPKPRMYGKQKMRYSTKSDYDRYSVVPI